MNVRMFIKTLRSIRELRKHEHWTRPQLIAHQGNALRKLRNYAYIYSPFYQHFHQGLFDHPLQDLPVLTKSIMMENFNELVTDSSIRLDEVRAFADQSVEDRLFHDKYWVTATSGSSGHPGFFLF